MALQAPLAALPLDHDFRPRVEPADIVRGRSQDIDEGVGETEGTDTLPGWPGDLHKHLLITCFPEAAADAVLTVGGDFNLPVAPGNRFLDLLFQNPGTDAIAVYST